MRRYVALLVVVLVFGVARAEADARSDSTKRDTTATRAAARDTTRHGPSVVPADSLPSSDARAVLRTIPEPLAPNEQVAPADSLAPAPPAPVAPDTSAADTLGVPTPEPTRPLGEGPGGPKRDLFADSTAAAAPPPAAPASVSPAAPDTCWRVQIAAPTDRAEAESREQAAASQLLATFVIESEQGRHHVRSKGCLSRVAAEALKARALESGFAGSFIVRIASNGEAVPLASPRAAPAKKSATVKKLVTAKKAVSTKKVSSRRTPAGAVPAATTPVRKKSSTRR